MQRRRWCCRADADIPGAGDAHPFVQRLVVGQESHRLAVGVRGEKEATGILAQAAAGGSGHGDLMRARAAEPQAGIVARHVQGHPWGPGDCRGR